jgi:hypothetical protein
VVPAAAQASTAAPGCQPLNSEQPWKLEFPTKGSQITCTFATAPENGTAESQAAAHVTFQVSKFDFTPGGSTVNLEFKEPGGAQYCPAGMPVYAGKCAEPFTGVGPPFYAFNPPAGTSNGPWSVVVAPEGAATGTLNLTFADNVASRPLTSTTAADATINVEGQYAEYTFDATEGEKVTFHASNFSFYNGGPGGSSGTVNLVFYEPDGSLYTPNTGTCYFNGNYSCTISSMPAGGTWFAFLEPVTASVGTLTLTMS